MNESSGSREPIPIFHYGILHETPDAVRFKLGDHAIVFEARWVPRSLIIDQDDEIFEVPRWWAEQEGLI